MSSRSAKFVCVLFASILAGANFGAVAENGTKPADNSKSADNCLSAPKGAAPAGSHWYYRLDRATKRHCWYVGEAKSKAARPAPQNSARSTQAADNAPPQQNPTVSKSVADARAEWTSPKSSGAPSTRHHRFHRCSRDRPAHGLGRRSPLSHRAGRTVPRSVRQTICSPPPTILPPAGKRTQRRSSQPAVSPIAAHRRARAFGETIQLDADAVDRHGQRAGVLGSGCGDDLQIANRRRRLMSVTITRLRPGIRPTSIVLRGRASWTRRCRSAAPAARRLGVRQGTPRSRSRNCWRALPAARPRDEANYFSSWRCRLRTNSVRPVRRSRLSRSALRIDCTSAKASSTFWLTMM